MVRLWTTTTSDYCNPPKKVRHGPRLRTNHDFGNQFERSRGWCAFAHHNRGRITARLYLRGRPDQEESRAQMASRPGAASISPTPKAVAMSAQACHQAGEPGAVSRYSGVSAAWRRSCAVADPSVPPHASQPILHQPKIPRHQNSAQTPLRRALRGATSHPHFPWEAPSACPTS